jgi:cell division protease FtsH
VVTGDLSSGAVADLDHAVSLARRMVTDFGMSTRLGPFTVRPIVNGSLKEGIYGAAYSERIASEIDADVQEVLAAADARAKSILIDQRHVLDGLAQALMEAETLEGDVLDGLLLGVNQSEPARIGSS